MIPGEFIPAEGKITLNADAKTVTVHVQNGGDRPIQVGSHYHFFETNKLLKFDREESFGYRLDIPAGTSVRFEPGEEKDVQLVEMGGQKRFYGLNNLVDGAATDRNKKDSLERAKQHGFIK